MAATPHTPPARQVALVTGGARGIGRATVRRLAAQGCAVAINYTSRPDAAEALAAEIAAAGGRAITVQADVADEAAVRAMAVRTEAELGPITVLVNNAGIAWPATLESWEPKGFARLRAVNVDGVIHGIRAVMAGMTARGYGRIVNVSSVASFGNTGFVGNHFYASTKAEVNLLTRRFAYELGQHGITVNAVAPGLTRSDMTQGSRTAEEWDTVQKTFAGFTILGRAGEPEEIAAAIAFLASPEASFITAQVLTADGGRTDYIGHG
jgi:NAD(P)-dependent dehydrogenase (short-subunit alcohol dehydrogenase family)